MRVKKCITRIMGLLLIGISLASCGFQNEKGAGQENLSADELRSFDAIESKVIAPKCLRCHSGAGAAAGVDLSSYAKIMGHSGLIVSGQPDASLIYKEVASGGMPLGGPPLDPQEVLAIRNWIEAGAPNGEFLEAQ